MGNINYLTLLNKIWIFSNGLSQYGSGELSEIGVSDIRTFNVLCQLTKTAYPGEVSQRLNIPPSTVSVCLKDLENRGFITRSLERSDLRRYRVELTDAGKGALSEAEQIVVGKAKTLFNKFSLSELETLEKLLGILN